MHLIINAAGQQKLPVKINLFAPTLYNY